MIELLLIVAFIVYCLLAVWVHHNATYSRRVSPESMTADLLAADRRVAGEFHRARHAMNDAAGQSWRNLAG